MKSTEGVARGLLKFIKARKGEPFTSLDARAALPLLNWSSLRAHLHWMGRTGRLDVKKVTGKKARMYREWPREERVIRLAPDKNGVALSFQLFTGKKHG